MNSLHEFRQAKQQGQRISMVTCYDYQSALMVESSQIDCVLVGDSVAMVMHGEPNTTAATVEMMALHTRAVARGIQSKWIVADMPFMSYRKSRSEALDAAERLIRSGAHSIKLEGLTGNEALIQHMVESGIPVMGHLGLTPQHLYSLGGFKVQGQTKHAAIRIKEHAQRCEQAGCFALVLECIPAPLAAQITASVSIPTIGIGAGAATDGQVLVWHDLLGITTNFKPRFVKHFSDANSVTTTALNAFATEVQSGRFPSPEHSYSGAAHADLA